ncbi:MAG: alpha,alpha-trehalose-phosphate synthase (UDP-forming) [Spongiibacteraceae bacterium]
MTRLVVVSNRVPNRHETQVGGLATAMLSALSERGGIWFGWSGEIAAAEEPSTPIKTEKHEGIVYARVDLTQQDHDDYYAGFSNRVLWPLFHYRPDLVDFQRESWAGYQRVNVLFATRLIEVIVPGDIIWIHDYHMIPLAHELRKLGVRNRIGFFLHIPLPPVELLRTLPCHEELMGCFQAFDLVGFQTDSDATALRDYYLQVFGARCLYDTWLRMPDGRRFDTGTFPISIDVNTIEKLASKTETLPAIDRLRSSLTGRALMIGVDRLDYSKGLPARFEAFGRLLENNRGLQGKVTLLQIAPPSREAVKEYQQIRAELEQMAGHINGLYAAPDWIPIRYINRSFPHSLLTGYYRAAQVALVTPLRDGMNLVAKEYVASQDPDDPGVLVLSRFAGAACEMTAALQVNPFDQDEIAEAMARALSMSRAERRVRWKILIDQLHEHDINRWRENFLDHLAERKLLAAPIRERIRIGMR